MVVRAVGIEFQRLLGSRYRNLCVCIFSRQIADQADFFVFREFVARVQNARLNGGDGKSD
jgi:hypothetical protein